MKKRLVIIPAFNEVGSIERTVEDIKKNAPSFDYVIINDHSMDGTKELCDRLGYNMVTLSINSGIGAAVQTGYLYGHRFGYDYAIQIDGDGQHDAKFLEKMADIMEEEQVNMLIGSRFLEGEGFQSTGLRRIGIRFFTWLIRVLTGTIITDPTSGMRMVDKELCICLPMIIRRIIRARDSSDRLKEVIVSRRFVEMKSMCRRAIVDFLKRSIYYMIGLPLACIMTAFGD